MSSFRIAVELPWDASACMGTGAYSETMVRALAAADPDAEIDLIVPREARRSIELPNVRYVVLPEVHVRREGMRQVALPNFLDESGTNVLFAPATLLPIIKVCPMVATVHDLSFVRHPESYGQGLRDYLDEWFDPSLRAADHVVAISSETKADLIELKKIDPAKVTVIEQPVRETFHRPLESVNPGVLRPYFFHVSNLAPHKNVLFLIEMFARSPGKLLVIAGGGPAPDRPPDFLARAKELGASVRFVGRVSDDELKALYQGCEAFLFPSLFEGWGLPVAEAGALGARVLASPFVPAASPAERIPLDPALWAKELSGPKRESKPPVSFKVAGQKLLRVLRQAATVPVVELVSPPPVVAIRGDWHSPSGFGQAARSVYTALKRSGVDVRAVACPKDAIQDRRLWTQEMYEGPAGIWIHTLPPEHHRLDLAGRHVGLVFWETDRLPEDWIDGLKRLDEVWTPSPFVAEILRECGIEAPVFPVPVDPYGPGARRLGIDPTWTVFLYVGTWDPRKRPDILVRAFSKAFTDSDRALLVIKSYLTGDASRDRTILERWLAQCRSGTAHVRLISEVLSDEEMAGLYRSATVFATASRGEGFGLPAVQAMSAGKPVLGVAWSALRDLVAIPVRHRVEPAEAGLPGYSPRQNWAVIDEEDLAERLAWVHANRGKVWRLGQKAREWVLANASMDVVGKRLKERVLAIAREIPVETT